MRNGGKKSGRLGRVQLAENHRAQRQYPECREMEEEYRGGEDRATMENATKF